MHWNVFISAAVKDLHFDLSIENNDFLVLKNILPAIVGAFPHESTLMMHNTILQTHIMSKGDVQTRFALYDAYSNVVHI